MADPKSKTFDRAVALHHAGDMVQAEKLYHEVLAKHRRHNGALNNLAVLLKWTGRLDEAEKLYQKIFSIYPKDSGACYNYALLREKRGDLDGAARNYAKALAIDPNNGGSLNNLGALCVRLGKSADAIPYLERATVVNPGDSNARLNLGIALRAQRRLADSIAQFRACVQVDPNGPLGWVEMVTSASEACDFAVVEEARAQVDRVAAIPGGLSGGFDLAGICNIHYLSVLESTSPVAARAAAVEIVRRLGTPPPNRRPLPEAPPLRIAYLSKNLGNHAIGHVSHGVYGLHDRKRFQVSVYALEDRSFESAVFLHNIRSGSDHYHEVHTLEAPEIAEK
ncbi:MAG: tetratricopeptide repeat protein, partial [Alphaproteobacteria bacterium]